MVSIGNKNGPGQPNYIGRNKTTLNRAIKSLDGSKFENLIQYFQYWSL